ncbi:hypothetical protein ATEIFO6365_0006048700 [Aspergillus terreus]|uniref:Uncharacterized protein n=1 Tax=Aspergillus terreus TaxID=33178 RepID=A0A5M3YYX3_ASPTE|nr:hypothetical protein ATETN484_0005048500 [Aspergillus terreus]GFF17150.1 hypothetical protein ATEIFO6365_0006048700 [Aspergillus terreus]
MSGSSRRSSLSGLFSRPVRMALKPPDRPLALRQESITATKTTLVVKPLGDAQAEVAYAVTDADDVPQYTVTGRKFGARACREFRDASGLPLFEIHRRLALKNVWAITLPGSDATTLATGSPRGFFGAPAFGNFNVTFENAAAFGAKRVEDRTVTLEVHRFGNVLASFDVVDGDRKVAEVRESIVHNQTLALRPSSKNHSHRPALDVTITRGVDTALISAIAVIAADWVFSTG